MLRMTQERRAELMQMNDATYRQNRVDQMNELRPITAALLVDRLRLVVLGLLLPVLIPFIQFGLVYKLWDQYAEKVQRDHCSNSCWDTVFKGGYETGAGTYKHVYFNATWNTFVMWTMTLAAVVALYESVKYLISLGLKQQLRYRMLLVFLSSIYPHYYSWWVYFNYFNDDFYKQCVHQMMFSGSEVACTLMVLYLCDKGVQLTPQRLLFIITIAASHVFVSGWDQFVSNVLLREGLLHQVLRDVGFMIPDIVHILLPIQELCLLGHQRRVHPAYLLSNRDVGISLGYIAVFWFILTVVIQ